MKKYPKGTKRRVTLYIVLRLLVTAVLVVQLLRGNYNNVFLCLLTLVLFTLPIIVNRKMNIKLPSALETIILLFIFAAEILGEIQNFYNFFPHWDTMLHTLNGFLMAAIGLAFIDILNQNPNFHSKLTPAFVVFVAFCFSMTIGVLWEFFEFGMDSIFHTDMQKDTIVDTVSTVKLNPEGKNVPIVIRDIETTHVIAKDGETEIGGYLDIGIVDTMKDLLVNLIGAVVFTLFGYIYIKQRGKKNFFKRFIPRMKTKAEIEEDK